MKLAVIVIVFVVFLAQSIAAFSTRPVHHRGKRVSDQRLAELETLIALSKMNGKMANVQLGYGKIDPNKIGRKRRSQSSVFLDKLFDVPDAEDADDASDEATSNVVVY